METTLEFGMGRFPATATHLKIRNVELDHEWIRCKSRLMHRYASITYPFSGAIPGRLHREDVLLLDPQSKTCSIDPRLPCYLTDRNTAVSHPSHTLLQPDGVLLPMQTTNLLEHERVGMPLLAIVGDRGGHQRCDRLQGASLQCRLKLFGEDHLKHLSSKMRIEILP